MNYIGSNEWGYIMLMSPIVNGGLNMSVGDCIILEHGDKYTEESLTCALSVFCEFTAFEKYGRPAYKVSKLKSLDEEVLPFIKENNPDFYRHITQTPKNLEKSDPFLFQQLEKAGLRYEKGSK